MKKSLLIALFAVLFLVACNSEKKKAAETTDEVAVEEAAPETEVTDSVAVDTVAVEVTETEAAE